MDIPLEAEAVRYEAARFPYKAFLASKACDAYGREAF